LYAKKDLDESTTHERNAKFRTSLYGKSTSLQLVLALAGRDTHPEDSENASAASSSAAAAAGISPSVNDVMPLGSTSINGASSLVPTYPAAPKKSNPLWRERKDVVQSGIVAVLPKQECKRQETIHELVISEEIFLNDISVLIKVFQSGLSKKFKFVSQELLVQIFLQPMLAASESLEQRKIKPLLDIALIKVWHAFHFLKGFF
jgi:hypothetical protein